MLAPLLLWGGTAAAKSRPNPYLPQARVYYQGLEYEKCLARLEQAEKWQNSPQEQVEIELYNGLCKLNLGRTSDAEAHFRTAVRLNPKAQLPPYTSPKIVALFEDLKKDAAPPAAVEEPRPAEPTVATAAVTKTETDAPTKVDLAPHPVQPSGAQQALHTEVHAKSYALPLSLGGAAVVAAGVGGFMGMRAKQLETQVQGAEYESDAIALGKQAKDSATFANIGFGVAGAEATAAIVAWVLSD